MKHRFLTLLAVLALTFCFPTTDLASFATETVVNIENVNTTEEVAVNGVSTFDLVLMARTSGPIASHEVNNVQNTITTLDMIQLVAEPVALNGVSTFDLVL